MTHQLLIANRKKSQIEIIKYLRLEMGNAAVIFLNNPPRCNCSFLYGKKETLAKGRGNVYNNLLGNVLNNHILSAE